MPPQRRKPVEPHARGAHNGVMLTRRLPVAVMILALGSCATPRAPVPASQPVVQTPPPPRPQPLGSDWRDWPLAAGDWRYVQDARGSSAQYGAAGAAPLFALRCDRASRTVRLTRPGAATALTVRTSSALRALAVRPDGAGQAMVDLPAGDPLLDAMGFSRGRFVVQQAGAPPLVLPAWAEVLRVTEDCRG